MTTVSLKQLAQAAADEFAARKKEREKERDDLFNKEAQRLIDCLNAIKEIVVVGNPHKHSGTDWPAVSIRMDGWEGDITMTAFLRNDFVVIQGHAIVAEPGIWSKDDRSVLVKIYNQLKDDYSAARKKALLVELRQLDNAPLADIDPGASKLAINYPEHRDDIEDFVSQIKAHRELIALVAGEYRQKLVEWAKRLEHYNTAVRDVLSAYAYSQMALPLDFWRLTFSPSEDYDPDYFDTASVLAPTPDSNGFWPTPTGPVKFFHPIKLEFFSGVSPKDVGGIYTVYAGGERLFINPYHRDDEQLQAWIASIPDHPGRRPRIEDELDVDVLNVKVDAFLRIRLEELAAKISEELAI